MYEFLFWATIASFVFNYRADSSYPSVADVMLSENPVSNNKRVVGREGGERVQELTLQLKLFKTTPFLDAGLETFSLISLLIKSSLRNIWYIILLNRSYISIHGYFKQKLMNLKNTYGFQKPHHAVDNLLAE